MKNILVTLSLSLFSLIGYAQDKPFDYRKSTQQLEIDSLKGTYELRSNSRALSLLPSNLAEIILSNRHATEVKTVRLNDNVELVIYPTSMILNNSVVNGNKMRLE